MLHTLPTPLFLQRVNQPGPLTSNLTMIQIKTRDSIFSSHSEPNPTKKKLGFLDLPAELRNQIYFYVFVPSSPSLGLFPSSENLSALSFLYTCRQIHSEAHVLAYALAYTVTNRWHRNDLMDMSSRYTNLPAMLSSPITCLELQTQWRLPYFDEKTGQLHFFDGFGDWARWVWDCLELFPEVKELRLIHTWHPQADGLGYLESVLRVDMTGYRSTNVEEPENWRSSSASEVAASSKADGRVGVMTGKIFLTGLKERTGRTVQIECVAVSTADLAQYSERSYGWSSGRFGKSWLPGNKFGEVTMR